MKIGATNIWHSPTFSSQIKPCQNELASQAVRRVLDKEFEEAMKPRSVWRGKISEKNLIFACTKPQGQKQETNQQNTWPAKIQSGVKNNFP